MSRTLVAPWVRVFSELLTEDEAFLGAVEEVMALRTLFWEDARLRDFLCSPRIKGEQRESLLKKSLEAAGVHDLVQKILLLMVRKNRQVHFSDFAYILREHADKRCGIMRGYAESAIEMSEAVRENLIKVLEKGTDKKVALHWRVNEDLVAGLRVRLGQQVLDTSLKKKLNDALVRMKGTQSRRA